MRTLYLLKKLSEPRNVTLFLLVLAGAVLRFWNLLYGLPDTYYPDEGLVTYFALNMGGGDLNPHHFLHPHLYYYTCFLIDVLYISWGLLVGIYQSPGEVWEMYKADPTPFYVIGRVVSAAFGVATIPVTYGVGRKFFNSRVGLMGTFFLTFSFLHIQWSHIGYMDAPLVFFVMLACLLAFMSYERDELLPFILCAICCGLAASTKYQGFVTFLWGPLLVCLKRRPMGSASALVQKSMLFLIAASLAFLAASPYVVLDWQGALAHWKFNWALYVTREKPELGFEGKWNWLYYLGGPLSFGVGIPVLAAAIVAIPWLIYQRNRRNNLFLSFPLVYFFLIGASEIRKASYILPVVPFACILAAVFLDGLVSKMAGKELRKQILCRAFISTLLILPSLLNVTRFVYLKTFDDTRVLLRRWADGQLPKTSSILHSFFITMRPLSSDMQVARLDPTVFDIRKGNRSVLKTVEKYRREGVQYIFLDEWSLGIIFNEGALNPYYDDVVGRYQTFIKDLSATAKLQATFSPYIRDDVAFDRDNVNIASRFLWKMKRMGPKIWVYQL